MRIAYLECFSGISGDMFLGALVDAGVQARLLEETVAALDVGARLSISRVVRSGISATKVDVYVGDEKDLPREEYWEQKSVARALSPAQPQHHHDHGEEHEHHDHAHGHDHHHGHSQDQSSAHAASRAGAPAPLSHGRGLTEIREIIGRAAISHSAKQSAIARSQ